MEHTKQIKVGDRVKIRSAASWFNGGWGIVTLIDENRDYHVAMYEDRGSQPIFKRSELRKVENCK